MTLTDRELLAAKHCKNEMDMEGTRGVYLQDFLEKSSNEYAKAFRRHVEDTSDTLRTAVKWIQEGKADLAADYLQGFIVPETFNVDPAVGVFLEMGYGGDKQYYEEAVEELQSFQETAAKLGLKISFEPA